ncbi:MAG TPA: AMP-binding protein, partial [Nocardioidaceae bacterium]
MTFLTRLPSEPRTIDEPLAYWAEKNPDGEAVLYGDRRWTWAEWNDRVRRVAGGLNALGVGRGDVVAFLDKNHPACVELSMAAASLGAANAIVNWRSAGDEVDYAVNDSGAKVLVVGSELMPTINKIRENLVHVERVIEVTPDGGEADDVCLVMYSSGTTGRPKGVMLTNANMIAHTYNAHEGWGFEDGDKSLVAMPLFHVGGSSYILFS